MPIFRNFLTAAREIVSRKDAYIPKNTSLGAFHELITQWTKLLWVEPKRSWFRKTGFLPMTPSQTFAHYRQAFVDRHANGGSVGYEPHELDELAKALREPSPDLSATQLRQAVCQALPALCGVVQGVLDIILPEEHVPLGFGGTMVVDETDAEKLKGLLSRTLANLAVNNHSLSGLERALSLPEESIKRLVGAVEATIVQQTEKALVHLEFQGLLPRNRTLLLQNEATTACCSPPVPQPTAPSERRGRMWWPPTPPSSSPQLPACSLTSP